MCCRNKANRNALPASVATGQMHNARSGEAPLNHAPVNISITDDRGNLTAIPVQPRRRGCCGGRRRRNQRGPLLWRLGKYLYARVEEQQHKSQVVEAQSQGVTDTASDDIEARTRPGPSDMPPTYENAVSGSKAAKDNWFDEKAI